MNRSRRKPPTRQFRRRNKDPHSREFTQQFPFQVRKNWSMTSIPTMTQGVSIRRWFRPFDLIVEMGLTVDYGKLGDFILRCFTTDQTTWSISQTPTITLYGVRVYATGNEGVPTILTASINHPQSYASGGVAQPLQLSDAGTLATPAHVAWVYPVYSRPSFGPGVKNESVLFHINANTGSMVIDLDAEIRFENGTYVAPPPTSVDSQNRTQPFTAFTYRDSGSFLIRREYPNPDPGDSEDPKANEKDSDVSESET